MNVYVIPRNDVCCTKCQRYETQKEGNIICLHGDCRYFPVDTDLKKEISVTMIGEKGTETRKFNHVTRAVDTREYTRKEWASIASGELTRELVKEHRDAND